MNFEKEELDIRKDMIFELEKNEDRVYVIGNFDYSVAPGGVAALEAEKSCDFYYEDDYLYVDDDFDLVKMKSNDFEFLIFNDIIFGYTEEEIDNIYVERYENYKKQNVDYLILELNVDALRDSMIFKREVFNELNIIEINNIKIEMNENKTIEMFQANLIVELTVELDGEKTDSTWIQGISIYDFDKVHAQGEKRQSLDDYVEIDYADRPDCMRY